MNKFRTIVMYFALVCVTLVLLFGVSRIESSLDDDVAAYNLRFTGQIRNAPPLVTFTTVALGSFRGIVADLLWLRAGALQEKENYYELVQLARWITDLQPTFSGATAYLAWNMAYNISVTCSSFEDRWRWVNEGIRLIRDQAIQYNPEDPFLYKELAWIFQHKLGNIMDDANQYYKIQLAIQLTNIVGPDPDWNAIAAAPDNEREFLRAYPEDHRLWRAAAAAGFEDYTALYRAFKATEPAALPPALLARIGEDEELVNNVTMYFRGELLRERLKLDPRIIVEINERYGEMDWRVPESQAIYWATLGLMRYPGGDNIDCDRVIAQSLFEAFRSGRILMVDNRLDETIISVPNLNLVDAVYDNFNLMQERYDGDNQFSTFRSARINFIKDAIVILYNYGKISKAAEYYQLLQKEEPGKYRKTLVAFAMEQFMEDVRDAGKKRADEIITGRLGQSFLMLLYNDEDAAVANERMARYIYVYYHNEMGNDPRTRLAPYKEMKRSVLEAMSRFISPVMKQILLNRINAEAELTGGEKLDDLEQYFNN